MKSRIKIPEPELLSRLHAKDAKAFSYLYDNYVAALYGVVHKVVGDDELAEDVVQEAFVKIWKSIEAYDRSKGTLFTWMLNVSRNLAIDKVRSKDFRNAAKVQDIENSVSVVDKEHNVESVVDHIGLREIVDKLKPEHKLMVDLLYFKGYTQVEVAEELAMPLGTVKTRIKAAVEQLRKLLS